MKEGSKKRFLRFEMTGYRDGDKCCREMEWNVKEMTESKFEENRTESGEEIAKKMKY